MREQVGQRRDGSIGCGSQVFLTHQFHFTRDHRQLPRRANAYLYARAPDVRNYNFNFVADQKSSRPHVATLRAYGCLFGHQRMLVRVVGSGDTACTALRLCRLTTIGREQVGGGTGFADRDYRQTQDVVSDARLPRLGQTQLLQILAVHPELVARIRGQNRHRDKAKSGVFQTLQIDERVGFHERDRHKSLAALKAWKPARKFELRFRFERDFPKFFVSITGIPPRTDG